MCPRRADSDRIGFSRFPFVSDNDIIAAGRNVYPCGSSNCVLLLPVVIKFIAAEPSAVLSFPTLLKPRLPPR